MNKKTIGQSGLVLALSVAAAVGIGALQADETKGVTSKSAAAESGVVTNENGCVSRTFEEHTITTNGNLVTEHRRVTNTEMDTEGNVLSTSTSEYQQSYPVGDTGWQLPTPAAKDAKPVKTDAFMGLKFGDVFAATNTVVDESEPSLLRAQFTPKTPLADFDDYYVFVTPKTHKIVKVCAAAKNPVRSGGSRWRRHYLIEALEKRYQTGARLCSFRLPYYAFDVAPDRYVTVCLDGASADYATVISAWDNNVAQLAAEEQREIREEARKNAAQKHAKRVEDAQLAF